MTFEPDWTSPPGDTIAELLDEQHRSPAWLADQLHLPAADVARLLSGDLPIDPSLARRLTDAFGVSTEFWLQLERQYRATEDHR